MILSLFIFRYILTKLAVKCAFYYLTVVENFMQKSARVVEMSTKVFLLDHSLYVKYLENGEICWTQKRSEDELSIVIMTCGLNRTLTQRP